MSKKMKFISLFLFLILGVVLFMVGVWAVKDTNFKVSGDITYTAPATDESEVSYLTFEYSDEVEATTSGAELSAKETTLTATVTDCDTTVTTAKVPYKVKHNNKEYYVTKIGNNAFDACSSLSSIEIASGVTEIGSYAFQNCTSLTEITIPDSVTNMSVLGLITNGVAAVNSYTFNGCTALTKVTLPKNLEIIGGYMFQNCSNLTTVNMPTAIKEIHPYAFSACKKLEYITLPNGLTILGQYAFANCDSLTSIVIPSPLIIIGNYSFSSCDLLSSVEIPNSVERIGLGAFDGCDNLQYNEYQNGKYLGNSSNQYLALMSATVSGSTFSIYSNCKIIGYKTFYQNSSLTSITLPQGLKSIGENAFYQTGISSITIPASVKYIESKAFNSCASLASVSIEEGDEPLILDGVSGWNMLSTGAFTSCTALTEIVLPARVTLIGVDTFKSCSALAKVTMKSTTPPTMNLSFSSGACFSGTSSSLQIVVPSGCGETYKAASGWSTYADKIVESNA